MKDLSVIILSYNTKELTLQTISSLEQNLKHTTSVSAEIIVVDNGSTDGSVEMLKKEKRVTLIENKKNLGFGAGNNVGVKEATGKYILLLNSDTIVDNVNFEELFQLMKERPTVGLLTVKLLLPDKTVDPACHRGFPTLWRSIAYFSKLEMLTAKIPVLNGIFGGYHLTQYPLDTEHEIDCPSGAFFLTTKEIYDQVGGFDETFFMYGEDLDLAFRIKEKGYKVWYYPFQSIMHIKGQSGRNNAEKKQKKSTNIHFYDAMKIFYRKHYQQKYPGFINTAVYSFLDDKIKTYETRN